MKNIYIVFGSNDHGGNEWQDIPLCAFEDESEADKEVERKESSPNKLHHIYFYVELPFHTKKDKKDKV